MRLVLITVITLQLLLEKRFATTTALPQVPSTDPCDEAPCGKGAECKSMGSIAICVCPNDGTGDPFVSCMERVENEQGSSTTPSSSLIIANQNQNQFIASFDVGSVHEQALATPASVKTTTTKPPSTTRSSSTFVTVPSSTTTTTRNPYVHVFDSSTSRPATIGHGYNTQHGGQHQPNDNTNQPESHRIPIISHENNHNSNHYPSHEYPPRPFSGGSSTHSPSYPYHGSSSPSSSSTSYNLFNEKTVYPGSGPIADYGGGNMGGGTTPYVYRGTATHMSGSQNAYEYDSRPITPTTSSYPYQYHSPPPHSMNNNVDRYGHHGYHPSSSGFPGPITESSASYSRYASTGGIRGPSSSSSSTSGSSYDIYNYNPLRNDLSSHGHHHQASAGGGFDMIADPMGKYENCRSVNGIVVCADNSNAHSYHHSRDPSPLYDRGELKTTTMNNYGSHSTRDRDHYSSYYPSRHASSTSHRPMSDYAYDVNRQGYPYDNDKYHGSRRPIDNDQIPHGSAGSSYYPHAYLPKEQRISAQSTLTISSDSEASSTTTKLMGRNDNGHPLCKSMCGTDSICRLVLDRPVCGCPEGHTGDPSVRCTPTYGTSGGSIGEERGGGMEECQRHVDCKQSEICAKNKCIDPCKEQGLMSSSSVNFIGIGGGPGGGHAICGTNAECLVVGHTPVCQCHQGNFGNPYVACVP